jgi:hypothetical protein
MNAKKNGSRTCVNSFVMRVVLEASIFLQVLYVV